MSSGNESSAITIPGRPRPEHDSHALGISFRPPLKDPSPLEFSSIKATLGLSGSRYQDSCSSLSSVSLSRHGSIPSQASIQMEGLQDAETPSGSEFGSQPGSSILKTPGSLSVASSDGSKGPRKTLRLNAPDIPDSPLSLPGLSPTADMLKSPTKASLPKRVHTQSESAKSGAGHGQGQGDHKIAASFRSIFGSALFQSGSILSRQLSSGSNMRVNLVTEAQAVLPSLAGVFSIENLPSASYTESWSRMGDMDQKSSSMRQELDQVDVLNTLEDPDYMDTVRSTDSAGSLLRRSMSVPSRYTYRPQLHKAHSKDIFADIDPGDFSAGGVEEEKAWRQTMEDLIESPEYLDTLESQSSQTGLLASTARMLAQRLKRQPVSPITEEQSPTEETALTSKQLKAIYSKNLFVLSISFMFVFIAYLSLRNLLSSLYAAGGLGLSALSAIYASIFVGCMFSTTVVQHLRPKRTMLLCMCGFLIYALANFYPAYYTLMPVCIVAGFSLSNLWTAHSTYLTNICVRYAELTHDKVQNVLSRFNGIFFAFFQIAQIIGGVISSLVLAPRSSPLPAYLADWNNTDVTPNPSTSGNSSIAGYDVIVTPPLAVPPTCGARYCHCGVDKIITVANMTVILEEDKIVEDGLRYILLSVYVVCILVGLAVMALLLDPLDGVMKKSHQSLAKQLSAVFVFFGQWRVLCLLGLMFYSLLEVSFMFGEFTKAYVSCTSGVYMVGYVMVCMSASSALSSFFGGRLQRPIGRIPLFLTAFLIQLVLLITMYMWVPGPDDFYVLFILAAFWGLADGLLLTQTVSLFGVLFAEKKERAFAGLKMSQSFSVTIMFAASEYMCTYVKIYILVTMLLVACGGYVTLEVKLRQEEKIQRKAKLGPTLV